MSCGKCVAVFLQAEDGIRDLVRARRLGDVYKRQVEALFSAPQEAYTQELLTSSRRVALMEV